MNTVRTIAVGIAFVALATWSQNLAAQDGSAHATICDSAVCGSCGTGCDSSGCFDGGCKSGRCGRCRGFRVLRSRCPECEGYCELTIEQGEEQRSCYKVEQKEICVPAITFPWQKCCGPVKCGKVKTVKVLKKHKFKCPKCECKWEVVDPQPCCADATVPGNGPSTTGTPQYGTAVPNLQIRQTIGDANAPSGFRQPMTPPVIPVHGPIPPNGR